MSIVHQKSQQIAKKYECKFLHISTDEVYGDLQEKDPAFTEESLIAPSSPYSASKAASDHLVRAWGKTYNLPFLITNCSNNYGPYQFPEKLIPVVILACIQERKIPIYGKGDNIRDWLFVSDHVKAILEVLDKGVVGETYNIGGGNELKNIEIVKMICEIMDKNYVYLCGGMEGYKEDDMMKWREEATNLLSKEGIRTLDPTRRWKQHCDYKNKNNVNRIVKMDLQDISNSTVLLCDMRESEPGKRWGSMAEVAHAHTKNKIIISLLFNGGR